MEEKILQNELNSIASGLHRVIKILSSSKNEKVCKKKIEQLGIIEKIEKLDKYGADVMMVVPLLIQILTYSTIHAVPRLISAIAIEIGKIHPDGMVTKYAFLHCVQGTRIKPDEIIIELDRLGYIRDNYILPKFRPMDKAFTFELDERYMPFKDSIRNILLDLSKDHPATTALADLLTVDTSEEIKSDIIFGLCALGHPAALPALVEQANNKNRDAIEAIVTFGLRDIEEFKMLRQKGIREDLWGSDLKEKIVSSLGDLIPFLIDALISDRYTRDERKLIAFFFHTCDLFKNQDTEKYAKVMPELYVSNIETCPISQLVIKGGKEAVPFVSKLLEENKLPPEAARRSIEVLGRIGPDAAEALYLLKKLPKAYPRLEKDIIESISKIEGKNTDQSKNREDRNDDGEIRSADDAGLLEEIAEHEEKITGNEIEESDNPGMSDESGSETEKSTDTIVELNAVVDDASDTGKPVFFNELAATTDEPVAEIESDGKLIGAIEPEVNADHNADIPKSDLSEKPDFKTDESKVESESKDEIVIVLDANDLAEQKETGANPDETNTPALASESEDSIMQDKFETPLVSEIKTADISNMDAEHNALHNIGNKNTGISEDVQASLDSFNPEEFVLF